MKLPLFVLSVAALLLGPALLDVANADTAPVWLVPAGMTCPQTCKPGNLNPDFSGHTHIGLDTGVWRSEGYDPGTSWPTKAFACPGQVDPDGSATVWRGEDDDDTGWGIKLAAPTLISGIRYKSLGWSGYPHPYPHRAAIWLSMDGANWTLAANISATLPFNTWTTVQATWPAVTARYVKAELVETDGSFTNMLQARLLAPSTTPRSC